MMQLQSDLDRVCAVAKSWNLRLNIDKCVVMRFGACNAGNNLDCSYNLDGQLLKFVTSQRDFGVLVYSRLHFHDHVCKVVRKARGLSSELLQSTICCSSVFMVSLFVSHIRSNMDFCSNVWNVGYLGDVRLLESVQRRWTREITSISHLTYVEKLKALELLSIFGRLLRADLIKC